MDKNKMMLLDASTAIVLLMGFLLVDIPLGKIVNGIGLMMINAGLITIILYFELRKYLRKEGVIK